ERSPAALPDSAQGPITPAVPAPPLQPAVAPSPDAVELLSSNGQQLEMRSGSVRLTLIHPKARTNS
ncbi:MAG: hypothetical protein O3A20_08895, partial [Planctomycetota bacterium]|nr:hypothetical protein [Planctomycetota bacterium]